MGMERDKVPLLEDMILDTNNTNNLRVQLKSLWKTQKFEI